MKDELIFIAIKLFPFWVILCALAIGSYIFDVWVAFLIVVGVIVFVVALVAIQMWLEDKFLN